MPRSGAIDDRDRRILELIQTHRDATGEGPTLQAIGDAMGLTPHAIFYRIKRKLVPAGLVRHATYERGSLKVIEQ